MPPRVKTKYYVSNGVAYYSLTGDRVRGVITDATHEQVDEALYERRRQDYKENRRAAARNARRIGAERAPVIDLAPGRARVRPDAPGAPPIAAPAPAPRAAKVFKATEAYNRVKQAYINAGFPYDGPADVNTSRMINRLQSHSADLYNQFEALRERLDAHYYKYNPRSHAIEMYTHRQIYLGTFGLPPILRNKRSARAKPIAYPRREVTAKSRKGGPTTVYGYVAPGAWDLGEVV